MKKNTRRIISLFLVCILAFGLAACSSGGESPSTDTKSSFNFNTEPTETTAPTTDAANTGDLLSNVAGLPDKLENPNISIVYWYNEDQYKYDTSKNANVYDPILEAIPYFEVRSKFSGMIAGSPTAKSHSPFRFTKESRRSEGRGYSGQGVPVRAAPRSVSNTVNSMDNFLFSEFIYILSQSVKQHKRKFSCGNSRQYSL